VTGPAKKGIWALKMWLLFKLLALITFYSNVVQPQKFHGLLIIYLALQHCLQNPNTSLWYWDMSHQMTWFILAHMPCFRRPGHIWWLIRILVLKHSIYILQPALWKKPDRFLCSSDIEKAMAYWNANAGKCTYAHIHNSQQCMCLSLVQN